MSKTAQKDNESQTEGSNQFPTSHDLLYLAVQLAGGSKFSRDEATEYVERAFWLWAAADKFANPDNREAALKPRLRQYSKGNKGKEAYAREMSEFQRINEEFFKQVSMPSKYPVDLDYMLTLVMPKRQPAERYKIYRDYLRHTVRTSQHAHKAENIDVSKLPLPGIEEVSDTLAKHRRDICMNTETEFIIRASTLFNWYQQYLKLSKSERAKNAQKVQVRKKSTKKPSQKSS